MGVSSVPRSIWVQYQFQDRYEYGIISRSDMRSGLISGPLFIQDQFKDRRYSIINSRRWYKFEISSRNVMDSGSVPVAL